MNAVLPWHVIVNPAAGRKGGRSWQAIERALRERGIPFEAVQTHHPGHGETLAREALNSGRVRILAVGGDGSVNEVLQGIMRAGPDVAREVTLAVAPNGTGNDWARSLGIGRDPRDIAAAVAAGRTMLHDVGAIDFAAPGAPRYWFINVAGAGFDARVTERVPRPVPSAFTYLGIALRELRSYDAPEFRITADDTTLEGRFLLAFVANARYCGNRMHVAPAARMDDGLLDVVAIDALSLPQALPKLGKLYAGRLLGDPAIHHLRASRVRIETRPDAPVQADGQLPGRTPAEFCLEPRALRVVTAR
jgi:YegS/Rv2252/BmrU family lipid kinase